MPQFDKITFFNQIFWLLLTFSGFYFLVLKNLLPALASGLKTRKKLVTLLFSTASTGVESSSWKLYSKNLHKFLKSYKSLFSSTSQK
jgi:F0F1-type ATP synthase membrane subunit b/b'